MADILESFCRNNTENLIDKWDSYFEVYDRYFSRYKGKNPVIVEIGVFHGGSLNMWNRYFDNNCTIYGIDINLKCKQFERDNIHIIIGDQGSPKFLEQVKKQIPHIDIIIDDGSHINSHQITTFNSLYPHMAKDGVFLCEDIHTSYWNEYQGGYLRQGTFIEYSKGLVDNLNGYISRLSSLVTDFTATTKGIHYHDGIVVFEKGDHKPMNRVVQGKRMY